VRRSTEAADDVDMRLQAPAPPVALREPRIVPAVVPVLPPALQEQLRDLESIPRISYSQELLQEQLRELESIPGDRRVSVAEEGQVQAMREGLLRQIAELKIQR